MLLNKWIRLFVCSFFLIPAVTYANVIVKIEPKLADSSVSSAYIEFSGQEAKSLWEYLKKIKKSRDGFVLEDTGMGVSSFTSPIMLCSKIDEHSVYGHSMPGKKFPMYFCYVHLNHRGLPTVAETLTGKVMIKTPDSRHIGVNNQANH